MAVRRRLTISDLLHGLDDPSVLALAQKVVPFHDFQFGGDNRLGPAKVVVATQNGRTFVCALEHPYGDPKDPMSWDDQVEKLRDCLALRASPPAEANMAALIHAFATLPDMTDVSELMRRLA